MALKAGTRERIRSRALQLLALREHSRAELERKLSRRLRTRSAELPGDGFGGGVSNSPDADAVGIELRRVLDELELRGLLSDRRTADAILQAKSPRYGSRRLEQMLQARELDAQLVVDTLAKARETELERATEVWRRRFGQTPATLQERVRQQRFLFARGFEPAVIERVLKQVAAAAPQD